VAIIYDFMVINSWYRSYCKVAEVARLPYLISTKLLASSVSVMSEMI